MRNFCVIMEVHVAAESFAGAEKVVHKAMADAFNAEKGENPREFNTLAITKGPRINK